MKLQFLTRFVVSRKRFQVLSFMLLISHQKQLTEDAFINMAIYRDSSGIYLDLISSFIAMM